jgi:hypothetical protein
VHPLPQVRDGQDPYPAVGTGFRSRRPGGNRLRGDHVGILFAFRARRVAKHYTNNAIIPMLCRKAGVPDADVRGNITSHRARSTIASQLYNAKEPITLFELKTDSTTPWKHKVSTASATPPPGTTHGTTTIPGGTHPGPGS